MRLLQTTLLAVLLGACGGPESPAPEPDPSPSGEMADRQGTSAEVTRAAKVAKAIRDRPDEYDAILAEHDMTPAEFERMLYGIATDPKRSAAYEAALQ